MELKLQFLELIIFYYLFERHLEAIALITDVLCLVISVPSKVAFIFPFFLSYRIYIAFILGNPIKGLLSNTFSNLTP